MEKSKKDKSVAPVDSANVKYRAVCKTCNYKGSYRDTEEEADVDGYNHQHEPGKNNHIVDVTAKQ
jgi:hypothetical protein